MNQISKLRMAESRTLHLRTSVSDLGADRSEARPTEVVSAVEDAVADFLKQRGDHAKPEASASKLPSGIRTEAIADPARTQPQHLAASLSAARATFTATLDARTAAPDLPRPKAFDPLPMRAAPGNETPPSFMTMPRSAPSRLEIIPPIQPEAPVAPATVEDAPKAALTEPVMRNVPPQPQTEQIEMKVSVPPLPRTIDNDPGPIRDVERIGGGGGNNGDNGKGNGGGGGNGGNVFHKRSAQPINFALSLRNGMAAVRRNMLIVMVFTLAINILVLSIPIYLFQISDRVLTSRSVDTLVMLTVAVVGAVLLQVILDSVRRFILMRTAVELEVQLGAPILSAAARASLHGNGRDYQTLGDLQQLRSFITSGTLIAFLDAPLMPLFVVLVYLVHPDLGMIVLTCCAILFVIAYFNQKMTAGSFAEANAFLSRANFHLDSMARNSQIINALAMIPEAVKMWGRETAGSLKSQVAAQDRNIVFSGLTKACRMITQVILLGWGAHLSLSGQLTGGMVIAASIVSGRALAPVEGAIEGWNQFNHSRAAYGRIKQLLLNSPLNFPRLKLPNPEGRLDVERILFVPPPQKRVVLNGISFSLQKGESLAIIGNSGSGKTTLGKMLVGSILPTSGNVRLDLMDLRNWDQRQFGESIGYLPQDVQLFPGTIKANICRMRDDVEDRLIYEAAVLADVHELIATFPQGYETVVASDGSPLSGGQKQRIALARAFFGNPKFVVLDEPNSNLDSAGETALARAIIHAKRQGITTVTITQRPALLQCVDKILVLKDGSVAMFGERAEVLNALSGKPCNDGLGNGQQVPRIQG
jgi:ATP-binding cassette subfamily C protein